MALSVIGAIGYVIPGHTVDGSDLHSNFHDGGIVALLAFGIVLAAASALRKRGFGAGMLQGILSTGAAIASIVPIVLVHMFSDVESSIGDNLFYLAITGLFLGGLVMLFAEPILYLTMRRAQERAYHARIPRAVAVDRATA